MLKPFKLVFVVFLILTGNYSSQEQPYPFIRIDARHNKTVKLNKGWKFHAGDNFQWTKPDYDDRGWQPIDPTLALHQLPSVKKAGIGWFRLKMKVDSSLLNERLPWSCQARAHPKFT